MHEKYQISIPCTSDHIIWLRDHIIFQSGLKDIQEDLDFGNVCTVIQMVDALKKISSENKEITHVAGALHPEKQYLRSEPNDFQRGEVEGKEGNLYFDKWDYDIKIKYINPV